MVSLVKPLDEDNLDDMLKDEDEDEDLDQDENDVDDETEDTEDSEESGSGDKRIRDLQSARDKETARANKLQKELDQLRGQKPEGNKKQTQTGLPDEVAQWVTAAQANVRSQYYDSDPRLKEYGISPELITGSTPAEMRASFQALRKMVDKFEAKAAKRVESGGIAPELGGGSPSSKPRDYASMSSDEFSKLLDSIG